MPESSSEINWERPPIFDNYPDDSHYYSYDAADVVQQQEDHLELIIHSPDVVQEQEDHLAQVPIIHSPNVVQEQEDHLAQVPIIHSPDVVQEQENHLAQVPIFHSPDVVQEQEDHLAQVTAALRNAGLESSSLIVGIDFTKSNEWTGKASFNNQSLHAIGDTVNPYEMVISIIGKTLAPFDKENLIPCFGFGDVTTHDQDVFSFRSNRSLCQGFQEVLTCYKNIVQNLQLAGPTSYAPVVDAAIDIVRESGGHHHVLLIISDGEVTRSVNTSDNELSPQENHTIESIVNARSCPLSIVLVRVGDGPWENMKTFGDLLSARGCDHFLMVNYTEIMSTNATSAEKETAFARAALSRVPSHYKAAIEHGTLGRVTGRGKQIVPHPPPALPTCGTSNPLVCSICFINAKDVAFGCGHLTCGRCGFNMSICPICREPITNRLRLFIN